MADFSRTLIGRSGYERDGFADVYDTYRPAAPETLLDILQLLAQVERPRLVVDLGAGTGLSTRAWAGRADEVVGVEANTAMIERARAATAAANVRYVEAFAAATGLDAGRADIVTCAQAFHWMEPVGTLAEVARVLRPGGVFAAYDYVFPPAMQWEAERAFMICLERSWELARRLAPSPGPGGGRWPKEGHLDRMRASGHFRYVRELPLHSREEGNAERLVGLVRTVGTVERALAEGVGVEELGLAALRATAERTIGDRPVPWFIGYQVRVGIA